MREFVLLFRMNIITKEIQPIYARMKIYMQEWIAWLNYISEKGQLVDGGNHLSRNGKVLKPNNKIVQEPYVYDSVSVSGYIIITAKNLDGATKIAEKCPILKGDNTSVEIREVAPAGE
jgi:hypothetical protein